MVAVAVGPAIRAGKVAVFAVKGIGADIAHRPAHRQLFERRAAGFQHPAAERLQTADADPFEPRAADEGAVVREIAGSRRAVVYFDAAQRVRQIQLLQRAAVLESAGIDVHDRAQIYASQLRTVFKDVIADRFDLLQRHALQLAAALEGVAPQRVDRAGQTYLPYPVAVLESAGPDAYDGFRQRDPAEAVAVAEGVASDRPHAVLDLQLRPAREAVAVAVGPAIRAGTVAVVAVKGIGTDIAHRPAHRQLFERRAAGFQHPAAERLQTADADPFEPRAAYEGTVVRVIAGSRQAVPYGDAAQRIGEIQLLQRGAVLEGAGPDVHDRAKVHGFQLRAVFKAVVSGRPELHKGHALQLAAALEGVVPQRVDRAGQADLPQLAAELESAGPDAFDGFRHCDLAEGAAVAEGIAPDRLHAVLDLQYRLAREVVAVAVGPAIRAGTVAVVAVKGIGTDIAHRSAHRQLFERRAAGFQHPAAERLQTADADLFQPRAADKGAVVRVIAGSRRAVPYGDAAQRIREKQFLQRRAVPESVDPDALDRPEVQRFQLRAAVEGITLDARDALLQRAGPERGTGEGRASDALQARAELDAFELRAAGEHTVADPAVFKRRRFHIFQIRAAGEERVCRELLLIVGQEVDTAQTRTVREGARGDLEDLQRRFLVAQGGERFGYDQIDRIVFKPGDKDDSVPFGDLALLIFEIIAAALPLAVGIDLAVRAHVGVGADIGDLLRAARGGRAVAPVGDKRHVRGHDVLYEGPGRAVRGFPGEQVLVGLDRVIGPERVPADGDELRRDGAAAVRIEADRRHVFPHVVDRAVARRDIGRAGVLRALEGLPDRRRGGRRVRRAPGPAEEGPRLPAVGGGERVFVQVRVVGARQRAAGEDLAVPDGQTAARTVMDDGGILERAVLGIVEDLTGRERRVDMRFEQVFLAKQLLRGPFVAVDLELQAQILVDPDARVGGDARVGLEADLRAVVESAAVEREHLLGGRPDPDLKLHAQVAQERGADGHLELEGDAALDLRGQGMGGIAGKDAAVRVVDDPFLFGEIIVLSGDGVVRKGIGQRAGEGEGHVPADGKVEIRGLHAKFAQLAGAVDMGLALQHLLVAVQDLFQGLQIRERGQGRDAGVADLEADREIVHKVVFLFGDRQALGLLLRDLAGLVDLPEHLGGAGALELDEELVRIGLGHLRLGDLAVDDRDGVGHGLLVVASARGAPLHAALRLAGEGSRYRGHIRVRAGGDGAPRHVAADRHALSREKVVRAQRELHRRRIVDEDLGDFRDLHRGEGRVPLLRQRRHAVEKLHPPRVAHQEKAPLAQRHGRQRVEGDVALPALAHAPAAERGEIEHARDELVVLPRAAGKAARLGPAEAVAPVRREQQRRRLAEGVLRNVIDGRGQADKADALERARGEANHAVPAERGGDAERFLRAGIARHDGVTVRFPQGVAPVPVAFLRAERRRLQREWGRKLPRLRRGLRRTQSVPIQLRSGQQAQEQHEQQQNGQNSERLSFHLLISLSPAARRVRMLY